MTKPGSCSKGFKSAPDCGVSVGKNGLDVSNKKARKLKLMRPSTARTNAWVSMPSDCKVVLGKSLGSISEKATVHVFKIKIHNKIDPSCAPQTAVSLYMRGNKGCELAAT